MDKVINYLDIQNALNAIKQTNKTLITNLYTKEERINDWIEKGQLFMTNISKTVFFFNEKTDFSSLFYCSSSTLTLANSLSLLSPLIRNKLVVIDIIGKISDIQSIVKAFINNGFFEYTTLNRMSRITPKNEIADYSTEISNAEDKHAGIILDLLYKHFDSFAEQLPSKIEVENWIKSNHIIIQEHDDEVIGFVIYDLIGLTSYLRYWFVHPQYRNKKIGSTLINEYFRRSRDSKRQLFWVIQTNVNAIVRYTHYGFLQENFYDYVMTNKNLQYGARNN